MSCQTADGVVIEWLREEVRDLRDQVARLREERDEAVTAAALARGGERFWRDVAERVGVTASDAAAVSKRILMERRTG